MTEGPAMTRDEALRRDRDRARARRGARAQTGLDLVGVGEMGIGNTTAASALTAVLTGRPADAVTGRGTGIDDADAAAQDRRHRDARSRSTARTRPTRSASSPRSAGSRSPCSSGSSSARPRRAIPVVLDGFITGAAALVAVGLEPRLGAAADRRPIARSSRDTRSSSSGSAAMPLLDLDLRLGEGTGAALAMGLIDAAVRGPRRDGDVRIGGRLGSARAVTGSRDEPAWLS